MIELTLPFPPATLSPNLRVHWTKLAKAKAEYRSACAITAMSQGLSKIEAKALHADFVFYPPNRRRYDLDGLLSRSKAGIDGLVDVCGVDDYFWSISLSRSEQIGGFVKVTLSAKN